MELDNLDSYTRSAELLALAGNVELAAMLVEHNHELGMLVGQKIAAEEFGTFKDIGFDFAMAEQCVEFEECTDYADAYGAAVLSRSRSVGLRDRDLTMPGCPAYLYRAC